MALDLRLERDGRSEPVRFDVRRVIVAGFTGRDQAAVRAHIEELKSHGIACPDRTPVLYQKFGHLMTTTSAIEVLGDETSGEAEFVLFVDRDRVLVAAGSDHTDRDLEKASIEKSKLVCPGVVSATVWDLADVRAGWDDLMLRSWATQGGTRTLYQEGSLAGMMTPDALLELVRERTRGDLVGSAIYSGTFAAIGGAMICGERFEVELADPRRGRSLRCDYTVTPVRWVRG